eukprot:COSAG03_NODE_890_length_5476_cov_35.296468_5_plen_105_part_00
MRSMRAFAITTTRCNPTFYRRSRLVLVPTRTSTYIQSSSLSLPPTLPVPLSQTVSASRFLALSLKSLSRARGAHSRWLFSKREERALAARREERVFKHLQVHAV